MGYNMQQINRRNAIYIYIFFYILIWQKFSFEKKIFKIESRRKVEQKRSGMKMEETEQSEVERRKEKEKRGKAGNFGEGRGRGREREQSG